MWLHRSIKYFGWDRKTEIKHRNWTRGHIGGLKWLDPETTQKNSRRELDGKDTSIRIKKLRLNFCLSKVADLVPKHNFIRLLIRCYAE